MPTFKRIRSTPHHLPNRRGDKALDDSGYLWICDPKAWRISRNILGRTGGRVTPPEDRGKLIDCQDEPTINQGEVLDVAVTPKGKCWRKSQEGWQYEGSLGDETLAEIRTERLVVLGNLTLPIVNGAVPLYRGDKIVGELRVFPVKRLT